MLSRHSSRSGPIPKRKAVLGQVYNMYEDAKKGKDAARIRAFIEVRSKTGLSSWYG